MVYYFSVLGRMWGMRFVAVSVVVSIWKDGSLVEWVESRLVFFLDGSLYVLQVCKQAVCENSVGLKCGGKRTRKGNGCGGVELQEVFKRVS